MSETLELRDARADEWDAVQTLTWRAYGEIRDVMAPAAWAGLEQAVRAALADSGPAQRIVALLRDRLVGSVLLYPPASAAYGVLAGAAAHPELRLLAVAPEARGHGVGEALVRECARRARDMGAAVLGLHTSASMRAAIRLYERMGFVRAPDDDFQPDGAELVTAYRLPLDG